MARFVHVRDLKNQPTRLLRDVLYADDKLFVDQLPQTESAVSLFTLLELAGIASFNLSSRDLSK